MKFDQVSPQIKKWFEVLNKPIGYGEMVVIQALFGSGLSKYVLPQRDGGSYLSKVCGFSGGRYIYIDLLEELKLERLVKQITVDQTKGTLVCIYHLEELIRGKINCELLELLLNKRKMLSWRLVFVTHEDVYSSMMLEHLFDRSIPLFPYLKFFPLWDRSTTMSYIADKVSGYSGKDLSYESIYNLSGGWAILAKRLATNLVLGENNKLLEGELLWLVEELWLKLSLEQRQILVGVHKYQITIGSNPLIVDGLIKTGLIDPSGMKLTVELLRDYLNLDSAKLPPMRDPNSELIVDGVVIDGKLSGREESVLRMLVDNEGKLITRDNLIECAWGSGDVSDWAIDSLISRLRKRLKQLGVTSRLTTKKGSGYIWQA